MWYCSFFLVVHSLSMALGKKYMTLSEKGFLRWVTCCCHGFYTKKTAGWDFMRACGIRYSKARVKHQTSHVTNLLPMSKILSGISNQVYYRRQYCITVDFTQDFLHPIHFQSFGFLGTQFFPIWAFFPIKLFLLFCIWNMMSFGNMGKICTVSDSVWELSSWVAK